MKWKYFLPLWLVVFLLAPSIWVHSILMFQTPPPGSDLPGKPVFIPFGGIKFLVEFWGQLIRGDFSDALVIFLILILPILIYTFIVSLGIYFPGRYIFRKLDDRKKQNALTKI